MNATESDRLSVARRIGDPVWLVMAILLASSSCFSTNGSDLVGRWEGRLESPNSTAGAATIAPSQDRSSMPRLALDPATVRVTLVCDKDQFEMSLHRPDGVSDQRSGPWRVLESRGSRWLVEFAATQTEQTVRLQIVFEDADHFTAREIQGDDRLGTLRFQRLAD